MPSMAIAISAVPPGRWGTRPLRSVVLPHPGDATPTVYLMINSAESANYTEIGAGCAAGAGAGAGAGATPPDAEEDGAQGNSTLPPMLLAFDRSTANAARTSAFVDDYVVAAQVAAPPLMIYPVDPTFFVLAALLRRPSNDTTFNSLDEILSTPAGGGGGSGGHDLDFDPQAAGHLEHVLRASDVTRLVADVRMLDAQTPYFRLSPDKVRAWLRAKLRACASGPQPQLAASILFDMLPSGPAHGAWCRDYLVETASTQCADHPALLRTRAQMMASNQQPLALPEHPSGGSGAGYGQRKRPASGGITGTFFSAPRAKRGAVAGRGGVRRGSIERMLSFGSGRGAKK